MNLRLRSCSDQLPKPFLKVLMACCCSTFVCFSAYARCAERCCVMLVVVYHTEGIKTVHLCDILC